MVGGVSTVADWIQADLAFREMWPKGMFFLMREHIQPLWEDPHNKDGGCFSFKVNKPDAAAFWYKLGAMLLGDTLVKDGDGSAATRDAICGVSISPKRNYCILRVWVGSKNFSKLSAYTIDAPGYTQVLFKSHEENNAFVGEA